jgi:hypothetical protein
MKTIAGLVAAMLALGTTSAFAAKYDISFDGYCDGMNLKVTSGVYVVGQSTGCLAGDVNEGIIGTVKNAPPEAGTKANVLVVSSTNFGDGVAATYVINLTAQTWANYYTTDGVTQTLLYTGTFSYGEPAAVIAGAKSSAAH